MGPAETFSVLQRYCGICKLTSKRENAPLGIFRSRLQAKRPTWELCCQTFQNFSGYKSAIWDYIARFNVDLAADFEFWRNFFGGYQRKTSAVKQDGVRSIVEGKLQLTFKGWNILFVKAVDQSNGYDTSIFTNFFLIMSWNLLAKCISVVSLMYIIMSPGRTILRLWFW